MSYAKDVTDPKWKDDPGVKDFDEFLSNYFPEGNRNDNNVAYGMMTAQTLVRVLRQCGDELAHENVMRQAANLKDFRVGLLLPDILISTNPTDYFPIEQEQMIQFKGESWELFGDIIAGEVRN